ncbi:methylaspartate mutase [[Actinomadura] parvosata]|uniref:methylaspartate mutase n=1 Tax=[Actinomadura] parvosata TaxID=1955412 RepID=UPI00406BFB50
MTFGEFVRRAGTVVMQPRMGFGDPTRMRTGLQATKNARARTVGTITLDSYTRVGDHHSAREALARDHDLNGYPIVAHAPETTSAVLSGIADPAFPVQVRHGSARPLSIVKAMARVGLRATEGGPVSYCLPYGRVPLAESMDNWNRSCDVLAGSAPDPHLETFGGCMLGQLCPPSLLIAISVLEARYFAQRGIRSVSLSYAQQTNPDQDAEAVAALRRLAAEFVPLADRHIVLYAYMGVYPRTAGGALDLLAEASRLAVRSGAERLIVKTAAEAHRIPTISENVQALEAAADAATRTDPGPGPAPDTEVYAQARLLVERVLDLHGDLGQALLLAFGSGLLDVPYCLHPDNAGRTSCHIDPAGWLRWGDTGSLPLTGSSALARRTSSSELLSALSYVENRFDRPHLERGATS